MTQIFHKMKYDLKGHPRSLRPLFCQNHSSTFVYGPILVIICMNANTIQTQFLELIKMHFYVMEMFCDLLYCMTF